MVLYSISFRKQFFQISLKFWSIPFRISRKSLWIDGNVMQIYDVWESLLMDSEMLFPALLTDIGFALKVGLAADIFLCLVSELNKASEDSLFIGPLSRWLAARYGVGLDLSCFLGFVWSSLEFACNFSLTSFRVSWRKRKYWLILFL